MPEEPYQNSNQTYNPYTPGGYDKAKVRKLVLAVVGVVVAIVVVAVLTHFLRPQSQQDKYLERATAAARQRIPHAKVRDLKAADGFVLAVVSDPDSSGQTVEGNTTIFKINADGSMKQLASASSFRTLDLLNLGIPLATQAKLTGKNTKQVKQNLADQCGYDGDVPGYSGFDGSFSPDEWQIDSATLSSLEQALSNAINTQNAAAGSDKAVICVNATQKNSNAVTDIKTYISTFTLQIQFITGNGVISPHKLMFATGPNYYRSYTLDGNAIQ